MFKRVLPVAIAAAAIAAAAASAAPAPTTFADPVGDSGVAPDLAGVTVSNDATGAYTFDVTFATDYAADGQFYLYLDTDKNTGTGDQDDLGADYLIYDDHAQHAADLYTWNGSDWGDTPEDTLDFEIGSDARSLDVTVNKSELGGSGAFDFFVVASDADGSDGHFDDAPSGAGSWEFTEYNALVLTAGPAKSAVYKKQRLWAIATAVVRSDTGATVGQEGTITCVAKAGATKLRTVSKAFYSAGAGKGSAAVCEFLLPKKHVKVTGTITVAYGGKSVSKVVHVRS